MNSHFLPLQVGLFFLGIFFPRANKHGAFVGLIGSGLVMLCCSVMNNIDMPYQHYVLTHSTNETSLGCVNYSGQERLMYAARQERYFSGKDPELHFGEEGSSMLGRVSPYIYASLGRFSATLFQTCDKMRHSMGLIN